SASNASAGSSACSCIQRLSTSSWRYVGKSVPRSGGLSVSVGGRSSCDASDVASTSQSKRPLSTTSPHDAQTCVPVALACHGAPQLGQGNVRATPGGLLRAVAVVRANRQVST